MIYLRKKGHRTVNGEQKRGGVKGKPNKYIFFTMEQIDAILKAIEEDKANPNRFRDHCAVMCAYHLALRISECAMLERECFQWMDDGSIKIRTLKQRKAERVKEADGRWYPPWKELPHIERHFVEYLQNYIDKHMRPDQKHLLISNDVNHHISSKMLFHIFITYLAKAKLSINYSWHAFRHARGVYLYERFGDVVIVQKMLRHKSLQSTGIYVDLSPSKYDERQKKIDDGAMDIRKVN